MIETFKKNTAVPSVPSLKKAREYHPAVLLVVKSMLVNAGFSADISRISRDCDPDVLRCVLDLLSSDELSAMQEIVDNNIQRTVRDCLLEFKSIETTRELWQMKERFTSEVLSEAYAKISQELKDKIASLNQ